MSAFHPMREIRLTESVRNSIASPRAAAYVRRPEVPSNARPTGQVRAHGAVPNLMTPVASQTVGKRRAKFPQRALIFDQTTKLSSVVAQPRSS